MNSRWAESRETRSAGLWARLFPGRVLPHPLSGWVHSEDKSKRLRAGKGRERAGQRNRLGRKKGGGEEKQRQRKGMGKLSRLSGKASGSEERGSKGLLVP